MSRGGRGGGGLGARMGGAPLPFDIDATLESEMNAYTEKNQAEDGDDYSKALYPPMAVRHAEPPTAREKRIVEMARDRRARIRSGPFFMGDKMPGKRSKAEFNAFEDMPMYGKRPKRDHLLPDLSKTPITWSLMPAQLQPGRKHPSRAELLRKANLDSQKKKQAEKISRIGETAEKAAEPGAKDDADDEEPEVNDDDAENVDGVDQPRDDDFSEDDDDANNDYNAEKYFSDGDENGAEEGGGDEGGGEDW